MRKNQIEFERGVQLFVRKDLCSDRGESNRTLCGPSVRLQYKTTIDGQHATKMLVLVANRQPIRVRAPASSFI